MGTQVEADGIPPLQGRHMIVCLGGYNDGNYEAFVLFGRKLFFVPVDKFVDKSNGDRLI